MNHSLPITHYRLTSIKPVLGLINHHLTFVIYPLAIARSIPCVLSLRFSSQDIHHKLELQRRQAGPAASRVPGGGSVPRLPAEHRRNHEPKTVSDMSGLWLVYAWFMLGLWLVYGWFVDGLWLVYECS